MLDWRMPPCADARAHPWNLSTTRMPHLTLTGRLQPGRGCTSQPSQRLRNAEGAIRRFNGSRRDMLSGADGRVGNTTDTGTSSNKGVITPNPIPNSTHTPVVCQGSWCAVAQQTRDSTCIGRGNGTAGFTTHTPDNIRPMETPSAGQILAGAGCTFPGRLVMRFKPG